MRPKLGVMSETLPHIALRADHDMRHTIAISRVDLASKGHSMGTSGPIRFDDGATASGLSYTFGALGDMFDDVGFQDVVSAPLYTSVPGTPYDGNVIAIQIYPKGVMNGNGGGSDPYFEIRFKARVR